jgi:ABC-type sulfate transport system permease subunit
LKEGREEGFGATQTEGREGRMCSPVTRLHPAPGLLPTRRLQRAMGEFGAVTVMSIYSCHPDLSICLQRAMGEFGAVTVISGNIIGRTQTLTLYVESAYKEYNTEAAFSAAVLLSVLALFTLFLKEALEQRASEETKK